MAKNPKREDCHGHTPDGHAEQKNVIPAMWPHSKSTPHKAIATDGWLKVIFYLLQFTWGATVNLAGLLVFLFCRSHFHNKTFHNAIVTYLPGNRGGLSLGVFIFLSVRDRQELDRICAHEYGHTIQCLLLGPLYWVVVAIPSVIWYHFFAGYRKKRGIPYDALFCERWATTWGKNGADPAKNLRRSKQ